MKTLLACIIAATLTSCATTTTTTTLPNGNVVSITSKVSDPVAVAAGLETLHILDAAYENTITPTK